MFKNIIYYLKDTLKDIFHYSCIVPYRKPSKRYRIWNRFREKRFLKKISKAYTAKPAEFDAVEVSIVMPVYNRAYCIKDAIESVVSQTHSKWKLLIVDDGSTDGLAAVVEPFLQDERITMTRIEQGGVAKARNMGLKNAKGKYVFYLDSDNKWYPDYLKNMIVFMEMESLFAAYSGVRIVDDEKTIGFYGELFDWNECLELNYIDINSFGHRNDDFVKQIMFDENLKRLVDWDFILAITANQPTAYAHFLGVEYYDGQKGSRITFTEHLGEEINSVIKQIQQKHTNKKS